MTILELNTGLFPDAKTMTGALNTLEGLHEITRLDVTGLASDDEESWTTVASAILAADLVVTL